MSSSAAEEETPKLELLMSAVVQLGDEVRAMKEGRKERTPKRDEDSRRPYAGKTLLEKGRSRTGLDALLAASRKGGSESSESESPSSEGTSVEDCGAMVTAATTGRQKRRGGKKGRRSEAGSAGGRGSRREEAGGGEEGAAPAEKTSFPRRWRG